MIFGDDFSKTQKAGQKKPHSLDKKILVFRYLNILQVLLFFSRPKKWMGNFQVRHLIFLEKHGCNIDSGEGKQLPFSSTFGRGKAPIFSEQKFPFRKQGPFGVIFSGVKTRTSRKVEA